MIQNSTTYNNFLFSSVCVGIIAILMFFITQGNSMFVTDLFAKKVIEMVDCETPVPLEERSDSGSSNNANEEYHYETPSHDLVSDYFSEINFHFENSSLQSVLKQRVLTPPPELS